MNFKYVLKDIYLTLRRAVLKVILKSNLVEEINPDSVISIVVIRIDRIGDVVMSLPAIKSLKNVFPNSRLAVLLRPENIPLLKNLPEINELIPYHGFFVSVNILRKKRFDMAVDLLMDYTLKTAIITFLSLANLRIGFDIEERSRFFNLTLKLSHEKKQMSRYLLDLIRLIGKTSHIDEERIQESDPVLFISEQDKSFADEFLKSHGIKEGDILFGLHPGGRFPSQLWMLESFAELAERISQKFKAKIIIVGSFQEKRLIEHLVSSMKIKPLSAVGLTLDKLASIIAKMDVFICNNSGPLHIAAALGTPTVSTMGPTDPYLWWPHGKNHIVIRKDLSCSPCNRPICRRHDCMRLITIQEIMQAVEIQMERIKKGRDAKI